MEKLTAFLIYLETMEPISFVLFMFVVIASMLFTSLLLCWTYKHKISGKKLPPFIDVDLDDDQWNCR